MPGRDKFTIMAFLLVAIKTPYSSLWIWDSGALLRPARSMGLSAQNRVLEYSRCAAVKQPKALATRDRILAEAARLFALKGYHDTKLEERVSST
jgi:hypothetical protein